MVYSYNRIVPNNKVLTAAMHNIEGSKKHSAEWKKPKEEILNKSICTKSYKENIIYGDTEHISSCLGWEEVSIDWDGPQENF